MELVEKKESAIAILDLDEKIFVIYIVFFINFNVLLTYRAQIVYLKIDKVSPVILSKYIDFSDIVSPNLVFKLPKHTKINNRAIN